MHTINNTTVLAPPAPPVNAFTDLQAQMSSSSGGPCDPHAYQHTDFPYTHVLLDSHYVIQQIIISALVVTGFVCTKTILDNMRRRQAKLGVVVVGAGPVGLTAVLVSAKCGRVNNIIIYEELTKQALYNNPHQIAFDVRTVHFLKKLGVDFDNIEGCWDKGAFYTRLGVFQEYMLSTLSRLAVPVELHIGTKFCRETLSTLERQTGRKLLIACDGSSGSAARLLGLSDEFVQHSCKAYGAVAALDRMEQCQVPMPERVAHNLHFDLTAYGSDSAVGMDDHQGFTYKVFGTSRHRYMALTIPKCESPQVKSLRSVLDRSMMRNIFLKCFNTYKAEGEPRLSDAIALKHMKFSPRLFEVKLSQRVETTAYFQDTNTFVVVEGEASRCYNIHTGMDVNVGIKGLMCLSNFVCKIAVAETEHAIEQALMQKNKDADRICRDFIRNGLVEYQLLRWQK